MHANFESFPFLVAAVLAGALSASTSVRADDGLSDAKCLECHGDSDLKSLDAMSGREYRLAIDVAKYRGSSHGKLECRACHERGYASVPHRNARRRDPFQCLFCHRDEHAFEGLEADKRRDAVKQSVHWEKVGSLFDCHACHDPHVYKPAPPVDAKAERVEWANAICQRCHGEGGLVPFDKAKIADGAHGFFPHQTLHLRVTACIDCHGESRLLRHRILKADEATRACASCHGQRADVLTSTYGSTPSRDLQSGVSNRDVFDEVYVIGSTRSASLDRWSIGAFIVLVGIIVVHGLARLGIRRKRR